MAKGQLANGELDSPDYLDDLGEAGLMLILDVKTRWTSTHQMLRKSSFFNHSHDLIILDRTSLA